MRAYKSLEKRQQLKAYLAKTFSETPPAYGKQKRRSLMETGDLAIQGEAVDGTTCRWLSALADFPQAAMASLTSRSIVAPWGSSIRTASSRPRRSCAEHHTTMKTCLCFYDSNLSGPFSLECITQIGDLLASPRSPRYPH